MEEEYDEKLKLEREAKDREEREVARQERHKQRELMKELRAKRASEREVQLAMNLLKEQQKQEVQINKLVRFWMCSIVFVQYCSHQDWMGLMNYLALSCPLVLSSVGQFTRQHQKKIIRSQDSNPSQLGVEYEHSHCAMSIPHSIRCLLMAPQRETREDKLRL